jgi:hypothetical protein
MSIYTILALDIHTPLSSLVPYIYICYWTMAHNPRGGTNISTVQDQPESRLSVSRSHSRRGSDVLEATELSRIRSNYSRATDSYLRATSSTSSSSPTGLWLWKYAIWKFWKSQISVIVPHVASRDHLGMYAITVSLTCHVYFHFAYRSDAEGSLRQPPNAASPAYLYYPH